MQGLSESDVRGVMGFVDNAWNAAGEQPFPLETLEALGRLIPCDSATYCELDRLDQRGLEYVSTEDDGDGDGDGDELFWQIVHEHPLCHHQHAYGDYSALRLSDVVSPHRLRASRVYADWFRPLGIAAELEGGIGRSCVRTRNFILDRGRGDFSDRDRAILNVLRPHLARIHEMTELRRAIGAHATDPGPALTRRESEILELVAAGLTNAAIAQRLWIAPGTVKKHLDNVYEKLGVSSRAAAAATITRSRRSAA